MSTLMSLPQIPGAFTAYKPSSNAHTDFLSPESAGSSSKTNAAKTVKVVKLASTQRPVAATPNDDLETLKASIGPILQGQQTVQSYHHVSAACHRLVLAPHNAGSAIHAAIQSELVKSVETLVRQCRGAIMARQKGFLATFMAEWATWEKRVNLLTAILVYLDRVYVSEPTLPVKRLALKIFREGIWDQELIRGKIRDDVLTWATDERSRTDADHGERSTVQSIVGLSKLLEAFDTLSGPYVQLANTYFSDAAEQEIQAVESGTKPAAEYVSWARKQARKEQERALACLDAKVGDKVVNVVRVQTGYKMSKRIVRRALDEAMDQTNTSALIGLYRFTVDVDVFGEFVESLRAHIEDRMRTLISDPANDSQMIDQTLKLKRFTDKSVVRMFETASGEGDASMNDDDAAAAAVDTSGEEDDGNNDEEAGDGVYVQGQRQSELEDAVRKGFRAGMGSRENAPAEWIAKHLDAAMRKGQGKGTEAEFNALLDEIIALIGFTRDKDVFKAFYSTQLAKRLLLNKSASDDMERNMIIKLQREMGEEFTSGDIMMKDLQLSDTLVKSYQTARIKNPSEFTDDGNLTANVLTESAWPAYPQLKDGWNFKLTPELQSSIDAFTAWYGTQHRNRQLSWRPQLGTVTLSARFDSGKYEIGVSLFQAVVLLHFNEDTSLEVSELQARTGIEETELVRILQSLSMGRKGTRVLLKKPPGKEVNPTDVFTWNKGFTSDRIKFRINQIQQDLSAEESKKTNEQVAIDRVSVLEATIVRIMKGRKKLTLQLLIDAVVSDVSKRFPPDVKEMKKRVESLIEREFLMRDEEDRNLLHYLA